MQHGRLGLIVSEIRNHAQLRTGQYARAARICTAEHADRIHLLAQLYKDPVERIGVGAL